MLNLIQSLFCNNRRPAVQHNVRGKHRAALAVEDLEARTLLSATLLPTLDAAPAVGGHVKVFDAATRAESEAYGFVNLISDTGGQLGQIDGTSLSDSPTEPRTGTHGVGGGGGAGKVQMQDFHFIGLAGPATGFTAEPDLQRAQVDYFLKLQGVDGDVSGNGYDGEVDILSWSWGETRTGAHGTGGGGGAGKVQMQDLFFASLAGRAGAPADLAAEPDVQQAAVDFFLKLDGIDGESTDDKHRSEEGTDDVVVDGRIITGE